jgi:hypothetical protein
MNGALISHLTTKNSSAKMVEIFVERWSEPPYYNHCGLVVTVWRDPGPEGVGVGFVVELADFRAGQRYPGRSLVPLSPSPELKGLCKGVMAGANPKPLIDWLIKNAPEPARTELEEAVSRLAVS